MHFPRQGSSWRIPSLGLLYCELYGGLMVDVDILCQVLVNGVAVKI